MFGDMIEMYKLPQGKYDSYVSNIVKLHGDSVTWKGTRGHSLKLFLERARINVSHLVTTLWNVLPEEVATAPSVNSLKTIIGVLKTLSATTKPPCLEVVEHFNGNLKI